MGYYTRRAQRVGYKVSSDFYTAASLGSLFGRLVVDATEEILGAEACAASTFVEIGAEPNNELLEEIEHPFADKRVLRLGDALKIPNRAVVFANELLDAQPFHRLCYKNHRWHELGVSLTDENDRLEEIILPDPTPEIAEVLEQLPKSMPEGYCLDLSLPAEALLAQIVSLPWEGLLLIFDYGKSLHELLESYPQGTARTYYRQEIGNNLLERPGEQDITCHLCWDRLRSVLGEHRFTPHYCDPQERFFMRHSHRMVKSIVTQKNESFDTERLKLLQLLSPTHMGFKFQVLWARRQS